MEVSEKSRTGAIVITVFSTVKIYCCFSSYIQVVLVLVILKRKSYVLKAIDKPTIEIGKFQEYLHIYMILWSKLITYFSYFNRVHLDYYDFFYYKVLKDIIHHSINVVRLSVILKNITKGLKRPQFIQKTVFHSSLDFIQTLLNSQYISNFVKYLMY